MFRVLKSGKRKKKSWKRMVTKVTFVGQGFTRKPPKYERFIRPSGKQTCMLFAPQLACIPFFQLMGGSSAGLRMNKAHVTHPELKTTFNLEIIGVK